mmetsp:Transcript_20513/g.35262  ORF Transcript_20513/g.35262 Transcript_20513/m.35262 type:complete len:326 (-) Transcript_20513:371-1348(-)
MKARVVIDTDGGFDDIYAVCLLCASKSVDVVGVTTVNGIMPCARSAETFTNLFNHLALPIPVCMGAEEPLPHTQLDRQPNVLDEPWVKDYQNACTAACKSLQLPFVPPPHPTTQSLAAEFLMSLFRSHPHEITLLCLGPLTNIATCIEADPLFLTYAKEVVIMGGAVRGPGNAGPDKHAELNFYLDSVAVDTVLRSCASNAVVPRIVSVETSDLPVCLGDHAGKLVSFTPSGDAAAKILHELPVLHPHACAFDAVVAAYVLDHTILEFESTHCYCALSPPFHGTMYEVPAPNASSAAVLLAHVVHPERYFHVIKRCIEGTPSDPS